DLGVVAGVVRLHRRDELPVREVVHVLTDVRRFDRGAEFPHREREVGDVVGQLPDADLALGGHGQTIVLDSRKWTASLPSSSAGAPGRRSITPPVLMSAAICWATVDPATATYSRRDWPNTRKIWLVLPCFTICADDSG